MVFSQPCFHSFVLSIFEWLLKTGFTDTKISCAGLYIEFSIQVNFLCRILEQCTYKYCPIGTMKDMYYKIHNFHKSKL